MTPAEAAALHARASANHGLVMWFVTLSDPAHPGRAVAYAIKGDNSGGQRLAGELVADTIEAVRAMLPAGLTRKRGTEAPVGTYTPTSIGGLSPITLAKLRSATSTRAGSSGPAPHGGRCARERACRAAG